MENKIFYFIVWTSFKAYTEKIIKKSHLFRDVHYYPLKWKPDQLPAFLRWGHDFISIPDSRHKTLSKDT